MWTWMTSSGMRANNWADATIAIRRRSGRRRSLASSRSVSWVSRPPAGGVGAYHPRGLLLICGALAGGAATVASASGSIFLAILLRSFSFHTHARFTATTIHSPTASAAAPSHGQANAASAYTAA